MATIHIPEDGGSAVVVEQGAALRVALRSDNALPFKQWFHFVVHREAGEGPDHVTIDVAGTNYAKSWVGYRAVGAADGGDWIRLPTEHDGDTLRVTLPAGARTVALAYFAPYPTSRRTERLARIPHEVLATSPDGLPLALFTLGRGPKSVWIIARQHPGETMAEWFVEGLTDALLAGHPVLERATFRIVPCVNVDGARRGNHRSNALGQDLNRAWKDDRPEKAPEVHAILARMTAAGVDMAFDIHGDEEIPHNFAAGGEGIPSWTPERAAFKQRFLDAWVALTPDFQVGHGYPIDAPGQANLKMCSDALAERFGCLSLTIEQPFADHDDNPDPVHGWSPARAQALGVSLLDAIAAVL